MSTTINAQTKYYVVIIVAILIAVVTYVQNHPMLTEADIIAITLIILNMVFHDLDNSAPTKAIPQAK